MHDQCIVLGTTMLLRTQGNHMWVCNLIAARLWSWPRMSVGRLQDTVLANVYVDVSNVLAISM